MKLVDRKFISRRRFLPRELSKKVTVIGKYLRFFLRKFSKHWLIWHDLRYYFRMKHLSEMRLLMERLGSEQTWGRKAQRGSQGPLPQTNRTTGLLRAATTVSSWHSDCVGAAAQHSGHAQETWTAWHGTSQDQAAWRNGAQPPNRRAHHRRKNLTKRKKRNALSAHTAALTGNRKSLRAQQALSAWFKDTRAVQHSFSAKLDRSTPPTHSPLSDHSLSWLPWKR